MAATYDFDVNELTLKAIAALENAYCPYSKFAVGAALLTEDCRIFTGGEWTDN